MRNNRESRRIRFNSLFLYRVKIITRGQAELQLAKNGVIENVVDCSFESSDDATVAILAQVLCQDDIKRLPHYGNTVLAIFLFAIASKQTDVESKPLSEPCLENFA